MSHAPRGITPLIPPQPLIHVSITKIKTQEGLPNVQEHVSVLVKGVDVDGNSTIDYNVRL